MATLTIRGLDDDVRERLRARAAEHGRSMEAEVREILAAAVRSPSGVERGLGTWIAETFAGIGGTEADVFDVRRDDRPRVVDFSDPA
ncbi:FitA-like ribbon-helix-helix domain-containing protein [Cellulosimicrobium composti]|uniref:FitA-like ribbon-helix-helix domain-containing protein n=1 Tax=Cellulosimicrobium composti TaxID=2672572 RepID=UPI0037918506